MRSYVHHLGDWAAHTAALPWIEKAAYHLLVEAYYVTEKPLPGNQLLLYKLVGAVARNEQKAIDNVLQQFFTLDKSDGCWHQKRCDEEITRNAEHSELQREKVSKRWQAHKVEKAINGSNELTRIDGVIKMQASVKRGQLSTRRTAAHQDAPISDTGGITGGRNSVLPTYNLEPSISSNDITTNAARVAAATLLLSSKGFEIENNSRLAALIADGATEAQLVAACGVAQRAGKGTPYVLGALANMVREHSTPNMPTEPPRYPLLPRSERGR
jgi:uncharacterized protein YdaU (DUF1376 family)